MRSVWLVSRGGLPTRLYKYYPPERIGFLRNGLIRFTPPSELNDPFEFGFAISKVVDDESEYVRSRVDEGLTRSALREKVDKRIDGQRVPGTNRSLRRRQKSIAKNTIRKRGDELISLARPQVTSELTSHISEFKERFPRHIFEEERDRAGVFSLSSSAVSQPMWAHYAKGHRGFLVEIDPSIPINVDLIQAKAEYSIPVQCNYTHNRQFDAAIDSDFRKMLAIKHPEWAYEKEWRYIAHQNAVQQAHGGAAPNLVPINQRAVTGVVLGALCNGLEEIELRQQLNEGPFNNVKIYRAQWSAKLFSIELAPENLV